MGIRCVGTPHLAAYTLSFSLSADLIRKTHLHIPEYAICYLILRSSVALGFTPSITHSNRCNKNTSVFGKKMYF